MERKKRDTAFESSFVMRQSKLAHIDDVKKNAAPRAFFPKKKSDDRSEKSKAFQRKWLG